MSFSSPSDLKSIPWFLSCLAGLSLLYVSCSFKPLLCFCAPRQRVLFLAPQCSPFPLSSAAVGVGSPFLTVSPSLLLFSLFGSVAVQSGLSSSSGASVLLIDVIWCAPWRRWDHGFYVTILNWNQEATFVDELSIALLNGMNITSSK